MVEVVISQQPGVGLRQDEILGRLEALRASGYDPWDVCQGHDLVSLLEIVLPVILARAVGVVTAERFRQYGRPHTLARYLRLSYERAHFESTRLYNSLRDWESGQSCRLLN